jgi:uncharacterized protein (TIGR02646 family)
MPIRIRSQNPPLYSHYRAYKKYLRIEFEHSCAYCSVREPEFGGSASFEIDHYAPQSLFPEKISDYSNLFYSCHVCNKSKGSFWPSEQQNAAGRFILNPCDHDLEIHFDRQQNEWISKTVTGVWNLKKLRLNSSANQRIRKRRSDILELIESEENKKKVTEQLLLEVKDPDIKAELLMELSKLQNKIDVYKSWISGPMD